MALRFVKNFVSISSIRLYNASSSGLGFVYKFQRLAKCHALDIEIKGIIIIEDKNKRKKF